jgi:hypothetical protein
MSPIRSALTWWDPGLPTCRAPPLLLNPSRFSQPRPLLLDPSPGRLASRDEAAPEVLAVPVICAEWQVPTGAGQKHRTLYSGGPDAQRASGPFQGAWDRR